MRAHSALSLQLRYGVRAHQQFLLPECLFEPAPVRSPPAAIQLFDHDFEDNQFVFFRASLVAPKASRRGLAVRRQSAKPFHKALAFRSIERRCKTLSTVVVD